MLLLLMQPELASDVSKFLQGLKSGKEPKDTAPKVAEANGKASKKKQEKKPKSKALEPPAEETPKFKGKSKAKESDTYASEAKTKGKGKGKEKVKEASEPEPTLAPLPPLPTSVKTSGKLVFPASAHWYTTLAPLAPPLKPTGLTSATQIAQLTERAASLLASDAAAYSASSAFTGASASDSHFLTTILSKGTLSDRLSALTLLVQASPVHNAKALETLRGMAERGRGKGGREEGLKAMRCVVDWWVGGGAPGRKLR